MQGVSALSEHRQEAPWNTNVSGKGDVSREEQLLKASALKKGQTDSVWAHSRCILNQTHWYSSTCVCKMVRSHTEQVKLLIAMYYTAFPQENHLMSDLVNREIGQ